MLYNDYKGVPVLTLHQSDALSLEMQGPVSDVGAAGSGRWTRSKDIALKSVEFLSTLFNFY